MSAQISHRRVNRVTALYSDHAVSIVLPSNATYGYVANRLDELATSSEANISSVTVTFAERRAKASRRNISKSFRDNLMGELKRLRRFALSLTRNAATADDLIQDTFCKAYANHSRFKADTNMKAWLFTILRNTYYSDCRLRRRVVSDVDGHHAARATIQPSQFYYVELIDVAHAIDDLSEAHQEALYLVGVCGQSYKEAAAVAGCAVGTLKSRVFRAREMLQTRLSDGSPPLKH